MESRESVPPLGVSLDDFCQKLYVARAVVRERTAAIKATIETVSNLAGETREPGRAVPRAMLALIVALQVIYAMLTSVALSTMPVHAQSHPDPVSGSRFTTALGTT